MKLLLFAVCSLSCLAKHALQKLFFGLALGVLAALFFGGIVLRKQFIFELQNRNQFSLFFFKLSHLSPKFLIGINLLLKHCCQYSPRMQVPLCFDLHYIKILGMAEVEAELARAISFF